jgi:uncharacterized protein (DUF427 family)
MRSKFRSAQLSNDRGHKMANQVWQFEPTHRWIRTSLAGVIVADSKLTMLMIVSRGELDYYFPIEDVRADLLRPSDHVETSGYRGTRRFFASQAG